MLTESAFKPLHLPCSIFSYFESVNCTYKYAFRIAEISVYLCPMQRLCQLLFRLGIHWNVQFNQECLIVCSCMYFVLSHWMKFGILAIPWPNGIPDRADNRGIGDSQGFFAQEISTIMLSLTESWLKMPGASLALPRLFWNLAMKLTSHMIFVLEKVDSVYQFQGRCHCNGWINW